MDCKSNFDSCQIDCCHNNPVSDYHEGTIVCLMCGLVLSNLFLEHQNFNFQKTHFNTREEQQKIEEIKDILDKIHVSHSYATHVYSFFTKNFKKWTNPNLVFSIFKVLNQLNCPVSMKELSLSTNILSTKLHSVQPNEQNVEVAFDDVVEKYCKLLKIPFKTIALIKESIKNAPMSGHNPNSVIAAIIYNTLKKEKKKISLRSLCKVTNVSCISIQRYNKHLHNAHPSRR